MNIAELKEQSQGWTGPIKINLVSKVEKSWRIKIDKFDREEQANIKNKRSILRVVREIEKKGLWVENILRRQEESWLEIQIIQIWCGKIRLEKKLNCQEPWKINRSTEEKRRAT